MENRPVSLQALQIFSSDVTESPIPATAAHQSMTAVTRADSGIFVE
jgi:hypothetical protein